LNREKTPIYDEKMTKKAKISYNIYSKLSLKGCIIKFILPLVLVVFTGCAVPTVPPPFGINKVITKQPDWQVAETPHFAIHYYPETEKFIPQISKILEEAYLKETHDLDYVPPDKTPFFVYASHNDFEETNISDITGGEDVGGFSEPLKNRLVIPLTGSEKDLDHVIRHEYTHILQFGIFYGGFWKSVRLLKSVFYPYWFMEGLAEYESGYWDTYDDMVVRDMAITDTLMPLDDLNNFAHLGSGKVFPAYQESSRFIHYIADTYGKDKISLLPLTFKDHYDSQSVLYQITKKDFFKLDKEFRNYLKEQYTKQTEQKKEPDFYGRQLTKGQKYNTNPVFSPNGKQIAFLTDRNNYQDILLLNVDGSNIRSLLKNKIMKKFDYVHPEGHALSWSPDGEKIIFAASKNQKDYLYIITVNTGKVQKLNNDLDSVLSPSFSPDGDRIVFTGMKDGITNLYLVDASGNNQLQLNDDPFDDNYPTFSPDGKKVLYISERNKKTHIFVIDIETSQITQITDTGHNELSPTWYDNGQKVLFIADADGIYNVYSMNSNGTGVVKLTDVKVGVLTPSCSVDGENMVFVAYHLWEMNVYVAPKDKLENGQPIILTKPGPADLNYPTEPIEQVIITTVPVTLPDITKQALPAATTGLPLATTTQTIISIQPEPSESVAITTGPAKFSNMVDQGLPSATTGQLSLPSIYPLSKGVPYHFNLSTDLFYPLLFYSTADGLYTAIFWQGSDMLGDHQLGFLTEYYSDPDFLNFQTYYTFKKLRPQFVIGTQVNKDSYYDDNNDLIKTRQWGRELLMSYPFDRFNRVELGLHSTDLWKKNRTQDDLITKDLQNAYSVSLVTDMSTGEMFDLMRGKRTNFTFYQARKVLGGTIEFNDYLLDTQCYATLAKNHILAWRLLGRFSEGKDADTFNLGGSDAVRGIPSDAFSNNRIMVLNTEYRFMIIPNINYHMWYILPDFYFKSLQGVLFVDTGLGYNTRDEFRNQKISSLKTGVGVGIRLDTFILEGFAFVFRLDYAKRTDAKDKGVVYFTLGPSF
jgi:Tol biopolymer transport system component